MPRPFCFIFLIIFCNGCISGERFMFIGQDDVAVRASDFIYHIINRRDLSHIDEIDLKEASSKDNEGLDEKKLKNDTAIISNATTTSATTVNYDVPNAAISSPSALDLTPALKEDIANISVTVINGTVDHDPINLDEEKNKTLIIDSITEVPENGYDDHDSDDGDMDIKDYTTTTKVDQHRYYQSHFASSVEDAIKYWVDLDEVPTEKVISHDRLSDAHRRALTVSLSFSFPFYGHILNNITIATGGFLFTGDFLHKWLAATQYIAPLMANFDTSISDNAIVKYADNGTALTVQWENVVLKDNPKVGAFTFQATIHQSGSIIFAYKNVPVTVTLIEASNHPVKVGLSDAYIVEKTIFYVRKRTIYEYHKIDLKEGAQIANWSAIVFEPLPNCVAYKTCDSCLIAVTAFQCQWCNQIGHCSDGVDRQRQDWLEGKCSVNSVVNVSICAGLPDPPSTTRAPAINPFWSDGTGSMFNDINGDVNSFSRQSTLKDRGGNGGLVTFFVIMTLLLSCVGWMTYAYFHPHTTSGQLLIKYRPSTWSCRRGHARYTAATMHSIHM